MSCNHLDDCSRCGGTVDYLEEMVESLEAKVNRLTQGSSRHSFDVTTEEFDDMKKMIDYPLFHDPVEITHALVTVASQENCDGPEYDLMMKAAEYIRVLESLLEISNCVFENQQNLSPEFVKIVEQNFWELLA